MNIRPLDDRLVVRQAEAETKTASGIFLPETAKEKPTRGKVISVGPGKLLKVFPNCPAGGTYKIVPDGKSGGQITCSVHGEFSY